MPSRQTYSHLAVLVYMYTKTSLQPGLFNETESATQIAGVKQTVT